MDIVTIVVSPLTGLPFQMGSTLRYNWRFGIRRVFLPIHTEFDILTSNKRSCYIKVYIRFAYSVDISILYLRISSIPPFDIVKFLCLLVKQFRLCLFNRLKKGTDLERERCKTWRSCLALLIFHQITFTILLKNFKGFGNSCYSTSFMMYFLEPA